MKRLAGWPTVAVAALILPGISRMGFGWGWGSDKEVLEAAHRAAKEMKHVESSGGGPILLPPPKAGKDYKTELTPEEWNKILELVKYIHIRDLPNREIREGTTEVVVGLRSLQVLGEPTAAGGFWVTGVSLRRDVNAELFPFKELGTVTYRIHSDGSLDSRVAWESAGTKRKQEYPLTDSEAQKFLKQEITFWTQYNPE